MRRESMKYIKIVNGAKRMADFFAFGEHSCVPSVASEQSSSGRRLSRLGYQNFYCATPRERYKLLLQRCPDILQDVAMNAIASFLYVTPQMLSRIRKDLLLHDGEKTSFGAQE